MAELVVVGFDNVNDADRALNELTRLQKEYLVDLEDAVVAIREPDGKVRLKQSVNLVGAGAATGGLWGGMVGAIRPAAAQSAPRLRNRRGIRGGRWSFVRQAL
jgi:uncharacterized membrane protein